MVVHVLAAMQLSGYIKVEILKTVDCKQRAKVLEYFLQVRGGARHC
jgi:hypothetical protein